MEYSRCSTTVRQEGATASAATATSRAIPPTSCARSNTRSGSVCAAASSWWLEAAAGGGWAMGRAMGAIAPGMRADLVVLDPAHPNLVARSGDAIANALIFGGGEGMVRDVMVGGQWRVRAGHHPGAETAAADYRSVMRELLA